MAYKEKSEAIKYNNDFNKKTYDRINLTVPKGEKDTIKAAADLAGESVNAYIYGAVRERMAKDVQSIAADDGAAAVHIADSAEDTAGVVTVSSPPTQSDIQ